MAEFLRLLSLLQRFAILLQEREVYVWMNELEKNIDAAEQAKTSDDKIKSLHGLMRSISSLG